MTAHQWTAADFARDAQAQQQEANDAYNAEVRSQRDGDAHLIYDPRPTRQELESADWAAEHETGYFNNYDGRWAR